MPRVSVFVLIYRSYDVQIFNEPFMDLLDPPAVFNIKANDKSINFRKFCRDMYK